MTDSEIERLAAEYIAEDWEPDRYYRDMNLIAFATKLLEHGYAEGRKDEQGPWATAARNAVRTMDRFNDVVWESGSPWRTEFDDAADALRKLVEGAL